MPVDTRIRHHQYAHSTCLRSGPICTPAAPPTPQLLQCFQSGNQAHCQLAGVSSLRSFLFTRPTPITRREWLKNSSQYVPLRHDWRPRDLVLIRFNTDQLLRADLYLRIMWRVMGARKSLQTRLFARNSFRAPSRRRRIVIKKHSIIHNGKRIIFAR